MSNFKRHKPPFWISVNLSDPFKTQMKQGKQSFCVTISPEEKKIASNKLFPICCIWSRLIWVSVKILMSLFRFPQNWSARFCFKWSLMSPKLTYIILELLEIQRKKSSFIQLHIWKKHKFLWKEQRNYYKNMNFARKKKFILWIFRIKKTLILWISGSKKRFFSTQEVGRKIFLSIYENLHDILRTETDDLLVLKKTIRWYFL